MTGWLAISKAGHDQGEIYLIVGDDEKYVYLCDGRLKTLEKPKKKSKKHIQVIKNGIDEQLRMRLKSGVNVYNEEIKRTIKEFGRKKEEEENV